MPGLLRNKLLNSLYVFTESSLNFYPLWPSPLLYGSQILRNPYQSSIVSMGKDDIPYTFAKLSGSASYKQWSREMTFVLKEAELWGYITGDRIKPRELIEKKDDNEDRLEKIDQRKLDRLEFDEKERRVVGKIGKMCTDDVQQESGYERRF